MNPSQHAAELRSALAPVAARLKRQAAFAMAVRTLTAGAAGALLLAMFRAAATTNWPMITALVVLAVSPLIGFVLGLFAPDDWTAAARAIDEHYGLDDRTLTALAASRTAQPRGMARLVLADALLHLETVKPREVVAMRLPSGLAPALGLSLLALLLALVPTDWSGMFPGDDASRSTEVAIPGAIGASSLERQILTAPGPPVVRPDEAVEQSQTVGSNETQDELIVRRYFMPSSATP